MIIKNMPSYAWDYQFIVYRTVNGEKWFWGAYSEVSKALCAMQEIGGSIADVKDVREDK